MPDSRASEIQKEAQVMLFDTFHQALHRVYGNATPTEMIYKTLKINKPVFTDQFCRELFDLIRDDRYVYRKWLYIPK